MHKTFTPRISDISFSAALALLFLFSCSTSVEQEAEGEHRMLQMVSGSSADAVTVAAIEEPVEEAYFDLIANTASCLGEDLWIGGKVESTNKVALSKAGAITKQKVYEVTDLTATGLNTNSYYTLRDSAGTLRAVFDEEGVLRIELQEGPLQLLPRAGKGAIMVAYQAPSGAARQSSSEGHWRCQ